MTRRLTAVLTLPLALLAAVAAHGDERATPAARVPVIAAGMARVGPAIYRPVYPSSADETEIPVEAFWLDVDPVTNADFLAFVSANPQWQRDRASRLFADEGYLAQWAGPAVLGSAAAADVPVTQVSWFAAKAYCAWRGKRLPTTDEWELAASASEASPDGRQEPAFTKRILSWYARSSATPLRRAGMGAANWWGVRDLHGLVWEWVHDFNSALVSSDNRDGGGADSLRFCGAGALKAGDKEDYAAFMRIAFRSSLEGRFTVGSLGCRCALDGDLTPGEPVVPGAAK